MSRHQGKLKHVRRICIRLGALMCVIYTETENATARRRRLGPHTRFVARRPRGAQKIHLGYKLI